jgi:L-iditol 2-dehydrogenase
MAETMKTAMYYNNNDVRIEEMPIPSISDEELLVQVKASGICGSDVMEWYRIKTAPRVLGHEITGDIVKAGKNIEKFSVGDRVFVSHHVPCNTCPYCKNDQHTLCDTLHSTNFDPGGFAEYLRVPPINVDHGVFKLPDTVSYHEGVFIEPLACVIRGMRKANFTEGNTIAVLGSGISGLLHIMLAKQWGAAKIFTTDVVPFRLDMAKKIGAHHTLDARQDIPKQIKKLNNNQLPNFVVVCTSAPYAMTQAFQTIGRGGTILLFAPTAPGIDIPTPLFDLWNKGITMYTTYAGGPKDIQQAISLLKTKKLPLSTLITHVLPLTKAADGFRLVAEAQNSMKIILEP